MYLQTSPGQKRTTALKKWSIEGGFWRPGRGSQGALGGLGWAGGSSQGSVLGASEGHFWGRIWGLRTVRKGVI